VIITDGEQVGYPLALLMNLGGRRQTAHLMIGHRLTASKKVLLAKAHPFPVVFGANVVRAWCWGSGPTIVLMHGWEGRGGQIGTFVEPLVDAGFRVVAFDAPAHGDSTGHLATAVDFAMALRAVSDWVGDVQAVIAHSMGALATTIALHQGLALEKIVFIGAPESPKGATDMLARILDLPPSVLRLLQKRLATMLNTTWEALTDGSYLDELDVPLLILHDRMDKDVPWSAAVKLSERWKRSELVLTEGLGHRRILKDPEVIAKAVDFPRPLADRPPPNPWPALQIDLAP